MVVPATWRRSGPVAGALRDGWLRRRILVFFGPVEELLAAHGLDVEATQPEDMIPATFRGTAVAELGRDGAFALVNYLRLGDRPGDRWNTSRRSQPTTRQRPLLILGVSRYKCPPVWVEATEHYAASLRDGTGVTTASDG